MAGAFQRVSLADAAPRAALAQVQARARNLRPALRSIGQLGVTQTRRRFLTGVGPDGRAWKKSRKASGSTLIRSGLLLRSISARPPTANSVEWGSNRVYAAIHQFGGTIVAKGARYLHFKVADGGWVMAKKVVLPARPYLGINAQNLADMASVLMRYLGGPLTGTAI